jgi:hypothetical protein
MRRGVRRGDAVNRAVASARQYVYTVHKSYQLKWTLSTWRADGRWSCDQGGTRARS